MFGTLKLLLNLYNIVKRITSLQFASYILQKSDWRKDTPFSEEPLVRRARRLKIREPEVHIFTCPPPLA